MNIMIISFNRRHAISVGVLWFSFFVLSALLKVEEHSNGGWEGEYVATYGFPFPVAIRQFDMWIPTMKQFSFIPWGIIANVVFIGLLSVGIVAIILMFTWRNRK